MHQMRTIPTDDHVAWASVSVQTQLNGSRSCLADPLERSTCAGRDGRRHALKIIRNVNKYRDAARLEINVLQRLHDNDSHTDKYLTPCCLWLCLFSGHWETLQSLAGTDWKLQESAGKTKCTMRADTEHHQGSKLWKSHRGDPDHGDWDAWTERLATAFRDKRWQGFQKLER